MAIGLKHLPSSHRNKAAVEPSPKIQKTDHPIEISDSPSKGIVSPTCPKKAHLGSPKDGEQILTDEVDMLLSDLSPSKSSKKSKKKSTPAVKPAVTDETLSGGISASKLAEAAFD